MEVLFKTMVALQAGVTHARHQIAERFEFDRRRSELGEGVISAAIAVLVIAVIGAAMYAAFNGLFGSASSKAKEKVDSIGG